MLVARYLLLAARYYLLVARFFLLVGRYYLLFARYFLHVASYFLLVAAYSLLVACYFLSVAPYFLLVACYFFVHITVQWNYCQPQKRNGSTITKLRHKCFPCILWDFGNFFWMVVCKVFSTCKTIFKVDIKSQIFFELKTLKQLMSLLQYLDTFLYTFMCLKSQK